MKINDLLKRLPREQEILITGHVHPDGDCIGSTLALSLILKEYGYHTRVILEERSMIYSFLPEFNSIYTYEEFEAIKDKVLTGAYAMIVLDSGDLSRIEPLRTIFEQATFKVDIDHHESNTFFGDLNIVDVRSSSTCELVGSLIGLCDNATLTDASSCLNNAANFGADADTLTTTVLNRDIATCLYTGIVYDTGVFKHSNTRMQTHQVAGQLVAQGIDFNFIINHLYFRRSKKSVTAHKIALQNISFEDDFKGVTTFITYVDLSENALIKSDTEMVVSMLNEIEDTYVSVFFLEVRPGEFKVSFRSNSKMNVCEVAKVFNGGGHIKASGCTVFGHIADVKDQVLKELLSEYKRNY